MSRAFTREEDSENAIAGVGERPISTYRNLVTERGLAQIEENLADLRDVLAKAEKKADRERIAVVSRDLRYWTARRNTAQVVTPPADAAEAHFGSTVTIEREDGRRQTFRIVGEDEADPAKGTISYVSPVAQALTGKRVGDVVQAGASEAEIVAIA